MQREGDRREITGVTWKSDAGWKASKATAKASSEPWGLLQIAAFRGNCIRRENRSHDLIVTPQKFRPLFVILVALLLAACTLSAQEPAPASPQAPPTPPSSKVTRHALTRKPPRSPICGSSSAPSTQFNKQYDHYATTLAELVHSGTFTKRMVNPDRGDYTASYKGKKDSYMLTMTPRSLDAQHRSFYAEDDGKIHADETKPADADSPVVK